MEGQKRNWGTRLLNLAITSPNINLGQHQKKTRHKITRFPSLHSQETRARSGMHGGRRKLDFQERIGHELQANARQIPSGAGQMAAEKGRGQGLKYTLLSLSVFNIGKEGCFILVDVRFVISERRTQIGLSSSAKKNELCYDTPYD